MTPNDPGDDPMDDREPWRMSPHEFARLPEASRVPRGSILALKPEAIDRQTLERYPTAELQALAQVVGVPYSGNRETTLGRILTAWRYRRYLATATAGQLRKLPPRELRRWLKELGQYAPPSRYGLAAALIGWRDRCRTEGHAALARANHYRHVRRAVRAGLLIPAEVLGHYPDLTAEGDPRPLFDRDGEPAR
jgi:hypothetical protein